MKACKQTNAQSGERCKRRAASPPHGADAGGAALIVGEVFPALFRAGVPKDGSSESSLAPWWNANRPNLGSRRQNALGSLLEQEDAKPTLCPTGLASDPH